MTQQMDVRKVFISHGHSEMVKLKLKNFIEERMHLEPVILTEQPDLGLTIIEKLEKYGKDCDFALILLTADDETADGGVRARQNVIHELGVFHGILGRDRVLLLKQSNVETFSNISGLIYKEFQGENIESVFEDVRIALESGSASKGGKSVPEVPETKVSEKNMEELYTEAIDVMAHEWPRIERENIKKEILQVIEGLPEDIRVKRVKILLSEQRKYLENRLDELEAEAKAAKEDYREDPDHGGKQSAMIMAVMATASPKSTIDLIDKLLSEISFLEAEEFGAKEVMERILYMCEVDK
jgi:CAP12/Pycsar effector protein, TIR domain